MRSIFFSLYGGDYAGHGSQPHSLAMRKRGDDEESRGRGGYKGASGSWGQDKGCFALGDTHYCSEIRTRCLCSLGRWPTPVELHTRFEVRQLEHGDSLSHRTYKHALRT